jgi:hypothetical protein
MPAPVDVTVNPLYPGPALTVAIAVFSLVAV